jgi:hypothetical protein
LEGLQEVAARWEESVAIWLKLFGVARSSGWAGGGSILSGLKPV